MKDPVKQPKIAALNPFSFYKKQKVPFLNLRAWCIGGVE